MPKEVLLYDRIDSTSSTEFVQEINEADGQIDSIRVNTDGGEPECGFAIIARISEIQNPIVIKLDGKAYSMGLMIPCCAPEGSTVECLDVTEGLIHRAAYPKWFEDDANYFTQPLRENLERINNSLKTAFLARINKEAFENLPQVKSKGITVDKIFSMDARIDVFLSAKDLKKIGLVDKIISITPKIKADIESYVEGSKVKILARYTGKKEEIPAKTVEKPIIKNTIMTLDELKANHPETYKAAVEAGILKERDRVGSIMAFNEVDPEGVTKAVESGLPLTETQRSQFALKQVSKMLVSGLNKEAAAVVTTKEVENQAEAKTPLEAKKEAEKKAFEDDLNKELGLNDKE
jgi:ATP-dependent protease ClpP protease subunit